MIEITFAKNRDIPEVLKIFKVLQIKNKDSIKNLSKNGFLVYPIDKKSLEKAIKEKEIFLVAKDSRKVVGYLLAYDFGKWLKNNSSWKNKAKFGRNGKKIFENKTIYFKHVGRIPSAKGAGLKLEQELFSIAKKRKCKFIVAEIAIKPNNVLSRKIHKKRGFVKSGNIDYEDGTKWEIYTKKII